MHFLIWIISGIIAGWLAGFIVRGYGFGCLGDLIVGLLGGVIGGWLFSALGLFPGSWLGEILAAAWFGPKGFASMIYGLLIFNTAATQGPHLFHLVALVILGSIILHSSTDVTVARWFRPSQSQSAEN